MTRSKRPQAYRLADVADETDAEAELGVADPEMSRTLELREEQLIAHKDLRELGEIHVRTVVEDVPGRLEVDAYREEVVVEYEAVGQAVSERDKPWEEDGVLVIPIYEEQLVVTKRLILRERMRVRRVGTTERRLFEDTLRKERLVIEDPQHTGMVREHYPTDGPSTGRAEDAQASARAESEPETEGGGFLEHLVRRALE